MELLTKLDFASLEKGNVLNPNSHITEVSGSYMYLVRKPVDLLTSLSKVRKIQSTFSTMVKAL